MKYTASLNRCIFDLPKECTISQQMNHSIHHYCPGAITQQEQKKNKHTNKKTNYCLIEDNCNLAGT